MLDKTGFDLWAGGYDKSVGLSDENNTYPFAGYRQVLGEIYRRCLAHGTGKILDIGFGTGTLAAKLYEAGCQIYGQDFSPEMIAIARRKMPGARLYCGDFTNGLDPEIMGERYDFIVATYALHHLTDAGKPGFIEGLLRLLRPGGELLIGDVAFPTRAELERCRAEAGPDWDAGEYYFVSEELAEHFPELHFLQLSHCAGVLAIPSASDACA